VSSRIWAFPIVSRKLSFLQLQKKSAYKAPSTRNFSRTSRPHPSTFVKPAIPRRARIFRVKGFYSCTANLCGQEIGLAQVYDLRAVPSLLIRRQTVTCPFGVVHHSGYPSPSVQRHTSSIARPNRYQSLHTTVRPSSQPFECKSALRSAQHRRRTAFPAMKYNSGNRDRKMTTSASPLDASAHRMVAGASGPGEFSLHA